MDYTFIVVRRDFQFDVDAYAIDNKSFEQIKKEMKEKGWEIIDPIPVTAQLQAVVDRWALYLVFKAEKINAS